MNRAARELTEILPAGSWAPSGLRELWQYRELVWMLALRDIQVRYKQTLLGIAWVVVPPFVTMLIFNALFGVLLGADRRPAAPGVPYAISTFCALVPWQLFANAVHTSGRSLLNNRGLISKVYFPRLVTPLAPVVAALVDFAVAFAVLLLLMAGYHASGAFKFAPDAAVLCVPLLALLAALTALSISIWLSALGAIYRDFNFISPFLIQGLMYVTPVLYTSSSIESALGRWGAVIYALNPMVGVVEGFRWTLLGGDVPVVQLAATVTIDFVLLAGGLRFFRKTEDVLVDVI
jgi:lipopolysaccharide transport system permease protein